MNNKIFLDKLDSGWGDTISGTYMEAQKFKPPYKYLNSKVELAEIYEENPEIVNGKELYFEEGLTYIQSNSFNSTNIIGELNLPNSLEAIEYKSFYKCTGLTKLNFGNSLKKIGVAAFEECLNLEGQLELPNGLEEISFYSFSNTGISGDLNIPSSVNYIGEYAFNNCLKLNGIVRIPKNILNSTFLFPYKGNSGISSFKNCENIKSVEFEDGLNYISSFMFQNCTGLSNLKLPERLTAIRYGAFYNCKSLTGELYIPKTVVHIGEDAFKGCNFSKIYIDKNSSILKNIKNGNNFFGCDAEIVPY